MSIFSKKNELYLLNVQADNETESVALAASDIVEAIEGSTSNFSADTMQVKILSGTFDVEPVVIGARSAAATLILPIRSWGIGISPDVITALRCADFAITELDGFWIATVSSAGGESGTIWHYEGIGEDANVHKIFNWKTNFKISGETGKPVFITFDGRGVHSVAVSGTVPAVTVNRSDAPALLDATVLIAGREYKMVSFEIDGSQKVEACLDSTALPCLGQSKVIAREMSMRCKAYMEAIATLDPIADIKAGASGALQIYWGSTMGSREARIDAGYAQIVSATRDTENGVRCWDLGIKIDRADFAIRIFGGGCLFIWDFGDGYYGYGRTVTHSYTDRGSYIVTLTERSADLLEISTRMCLVTVSEYSTVYNWDWAGDIDDGQVVTYSWTTKGSKIVTLTCVSADATVTRSCIITITNYLPAVYLWSVGGTESVRSYSWSTFGTKIVSLQVSAADEAASIRYVQIQVDDQTIEATWHYGDGVSDALGVHEYSEAGVFDVTLDVSNKNDSDSLTENDYITVTEA